MKLFGKRILLRLSLLGSLFFICQVMVAMPQYAVVVEAPSCFIKQQEECIIKMYFAGSELDIKGLCVLPPCGYREEFSLVITPGVTFKTRGNKNVVSYLKRHKDAPCLWYDITLVRLESEEAAESGDSDVAPKEVYTWRIRQRNLDEVPLLLPEHTVLLVMDPALLQSIENKTTELYGPNKVIYLPKLILKKDICREAFEDAQLRAVLGSIDIDSIHEKERPRRCVSAPSSTQGTCFCS